MRRWAERAEWATEDWATVLVAVVILLVLAFVLMLPWAFAQMAIETMPGVTYYDYGQTQGVEIVPGVTHFSGAVEGTVTELRPGVRFYDLHPNLATEFSQRAAEHGREMEAWQEQMDRDLAKIRHESEARRKQNGR